LTYREPLPVEKDSHQSVHRAAGNVVKDQLTSVTPRGNSLLSCPM